MLARDEASKLKLLWNLHLEMPKSVKMRGKGLYENKFGWKALRIRISVLRKLTTLIIHLWLRVGQSTLPMFRGTLSTVTLTVEAGRSGGLRRRNGLFTVFLSSFSYMLFWVSLGREQHKNLSNQPVSHLINQSIIQ